MAGLRYAKIGLAVFIALIVPGVILVKDAGDAAIQAVGAVSFIACCAVYLTLDMRAERREREEAQ